MSQEDPRKTTSLRELEERGVAGTTGNRNAKEVLKNTKAARNLREQERMRIERVLLTRALNQTTDSNQ